jgi:hypothetical protein
MQRRAAPPQRAIAFRAPSAGASSAPAALPEPLLKALDLLRRAPERPVGIWRFVEGVRLPLGARPAWSSVVRSRAAPPRAAVIAPPAAVSSAAVEARSAIPIRP